MDWGLRSGGRIGPSEFLLGCASLASGAALLAAVFGDLPLRVTLPLLGGFAVLVGASVWRATPVGRRARLRRRFIAGLIAGIVATAAYDLVRFASTRAGHMEFSPFETLPVFGRLILGDGAGNPAIVVAGVAYHALNGIMFAAAYAILLAGRSWAWGIAWGLGLEAFMIAVYPYWLDLRPVLGDFLLISFVGHLAYGSTLGLVTAQILKRG